MEEVDKNTDEEAEERLITIFLNLFASTSSDFISKRKVSICCYLLEFSHKKLTMLWGAQEKTKYLFKKSKTLAPESHLIKKNFFKISRPSDYEDSAVEVIENTEEDAEERLKLLIYLTFLPRSK